MNAALLLSREDRAAHVLKLCEYASRGLVPDLDDVEDESMGLLKGSYDAIATKLRYLMPRSSAQWKPEFERALESSHSMRVETIEVSRKQAIGGVQGKCMACGRNESNCRYAIDLAGSMQPRDWLRGPERVSDLYASFKREYESVYESDFVSNCVSEGRLPAVDKGCFVVGQTCLRKAKLRYALQTLLLETCYACDRDLEELEAQHGSRLALEGDVLYTITDERCQDFVRRQDDLELAVADDKRYAPDVPIDNDFWDIIDECRNGISGGSESVFNEMIRKRANRTLSNLRSGGNQSEEDSDDDDVVEGSDYADESDASEEDVASKRNAPRKRACVIEDENSDEEGGRDDRGGYPTRSSTSKRARPDAPGEASSSTGAGTSRGAEGLNDDGPAMPTAGSRRSTPLSISGMVGMQRAAGILPSRNEAVVQLMELQVRLAKNRNHRDATVCTNAILTLQELVQRVEELSHTVGI